MALGKLRRRVRPAPLPKLHITAMMDMFTIIMIFLLVSFTDRPVKVDLDRTLELPRSAAKMDYTESIHLVLSRSALVLQGEVIGRCDGDRVEGLDPRNLEASELYRRLRAFREEADRLKAQGVETRRHLLFFCDRRQRFKAINTVIKAAGMAGYPDLQFAVLEE